MLNFVTDTEIQSYLADNGYARHIVEAGREGLLRRYREFVGEVERGYDYSLLDYRNDLDCRAILHLVGLDSEVTGLDDRLDAMLDHREARVWESSAGEPFWDFGYPKNARGLLLRGLRQEGLVVT